MNTILERLDSTNQIVTDAIWEDSVADQAVRHAERDAAKAIAQADRDLAIALSGLGLRRWQNLMDHTATLATPADGLDLVIAHRHADKIRAALYRRTEVAAEHGFKIRLATARRTAAHRAVKHLTCPGLA